MSMYEIIFDPPPEAADLLHHLGLRRRDIMRFRNAWVEPDGEGGYRVAVYTRLGGNNRKIYPQAWDWLHAHPHFLFDRDDKFDTTYATAYFRIAEDDIPDWAPREDEQVDMDARWLYELANLDKNEGAIKRAEPMMERLRRDMESSDPGIKITEV